MIFNIGGRINPATQMPAFTFDGEYDLINDGFSNGVQNWRIRLYDSGSIRFTRVVSDVEVFLVGGGGGGVPAGGRVDPERRRALPAAGTGPERHDLQGERPDRSDEADAEGL